MVFTAPEDAKPKQKQKDGLECIGCGALEASEWRGPGGRYGACCRKKADKARAALNVDAKDLKIQQLEAGLAAALEQMKEMQKRQDVADELLSKHEKMVNESSDALNSLDDEFQALERRVARLPQQLLMKPTAGVKRPVLADLPPREQRVLHFRQTPEGS